MTFQSIVETVQGFGIVGTLYSDSPRVSETFTLNSVNASNNVYGRAFTINPTSSLFAKAGGSQGLFNSFIGILVNPKTGASYGSSAFGPLDPSLILPNGAVGEFLTQGFIYAYVATGVSGPPKVGDQVFYNISDGSLVAFIGGIIPPGLSFAHANVEEFDPLTNLCVIEVNYAPIQEYE